MLNIVDEPIFKVMEDEEEEVEEVEEEGEDGEEVEEEESEPEGVMTDYEDLPDEVDSMIGGDGELEEGNTETLGLEVEEEEDEYEEIDLQKIPQETRESYILNHHPELIQHNNEEISSMSKVTRDDNRKIVDPLHKTNPWITKYERARVLGSRAKQINHDADVFVNVPDNIIDGYSIALLEYKAKKNTIYYS